MNLVGKDGKGESVWLAWFLVENLELFAGLARDRNDQEFAELCSAQATQLRSNIEAQAWDGAWYRRAYFDDGTPLGSSSNDECQIDSISQSWAVISKGGDPVRARQAMAAVDQRLVRRDKQIIQLLDPPFDKSDLEPGYIKGYIPGVRENGGQYTHAAIWTTMAFAMMGDTNARGNSSPCSIPSITAARRRRSSATRSNPMSCARTSMACRRTPAAAAGPGTPARRAGCTG